MRDVVRRGARLGALIGAWPAGIFGTLCLVTAIVFLVGDMRGTFWAILGIGAGAALACMTVCPALGAATGLVLAVAPRRLLAHPLPRGLLAALTMGLPLATLSLVLLRGDGYSLADYPPSTHLLFWSLPLAAALVTAAHSGEIASGKPAATG
ncbi:hypothetical protein [Streptomyces sp. NPDC020951]|uniref:hypothetical protein n=1 Tax=Streptomyces sp. NPDC020951 TaxID=3365104 RepID=UPI00379A6C99